MSHYVVASAHDNLGQGSDAYAAADRALNMPLPAAYREMAHVKEHIKNLTGIRAKYGGKK
jgi:hypothetical protein